MTFALQTLMTFALTVSAVTALALLLTRLLRSRISACSLYAAWCVVLLCALIPLRPSFARPVVTLSAAPVAQAAETPVFRREVNAVPAAPAQDQSSNTLPMGTYVAPAVSVSAVWNHAPSHTSAARPALNIGTLALLTYALGAFITLALTLHRHIRYTRMVRRWRHPVVDRRVLAVYDMVCEDMNIRRRPALEMCSMVDSPLLLGLFRPVILLPDDTLSIRELRLILCHELTHYTRGDLFIKVLVMLSVSLHWYNPLIHLMQREVNYACEASCDERVVRGTDLDARQYYSETIIAVIRRQSRLHSALSTSFYGGKKGMKNRILTIMDTRARRLGALLLCPVLLMAMVFGVAFASEPAASMQEYPSVRTLFDSEKDPITEEQAQQIALDLYCRVRNSGNPLDKPYKFVDYQVGEYLFGTVMLEAAYVDIAIEFGNEYDDDFVYRAYIAPRTGTPLSLKPVSRGVVAFPYWQNDTVIFNAETAALEATLPRAAYVNNAVSASANACQITTDYDWPQGTYMNGTPVTVLEVSHMNNNAPEVTDAETIYWARIQVGKTAKSEGVVAWTPLCTLTFADQLIGDLAAFPQGTVSTHNATGFTSVFGECSTRSGVVSTLSNGAPVQIMGMFANFYHVKTTSGEAGFIPRGEVVLDAQTQLLMDSVAPDNYDKIQPGQDDEYEEYMAAVEVYWEKYGDSNEFPLDAAAAVSQLRVDYGFDLDLAMHVMPGEQDIPQSEARAFADARIKELYDMDEGDYTACYPFFYYEPAAPDTRIWKFRYTAVPGQRDVTVWFDQQYNIVRDYQNEWINAYRISEEERNAMLTELSYYQSFGVQIGTENNEALLQKADEVFAAAFPEAGDLSGYDRTGALYLDASGYDSNLTWYMVTYTTNDKTMPSDYKCAFDVVFIQSDPEQVLHADPDSFRGLLKDQEQMFRRAELELVRGPFYTWTVEEKAEFDPESYFLPPEGTISRDKALDAAKAALKNEGLTDEYIAQHSAFFAYTFYEDYKSSIQCWRIDFYTPEAMNGPMLDGYIVFIHPETGEVISLWSPGGNG